MEKTGKNRGGGSCIKYHICCIMSVVFYAVFFCCAKAAEFDPLANLKRTEYEKMKKTFALTLVLALVFALCSVGLAAANTTTVTTLTDLQNAIASAGAGDTIILGDNIVAGSLVTIPAGTDVILDLNGKELSADRGYLVSVEEGAKLTINDASGTNAGAITNSGYAIVNYGTLIVNGGTITGNYALYNGRYTSSAASATLNGGVFNSSSFAIANCANMTVAGATVNGWLDTSGNFTMTSGDVENFNAGSADAAVASGSSTNITGGSIDFLNVQSRASSVGPNEVSVGGATTVGELQIAVQDGTADANINTVDITGGDFGPITTVSFDAGNNETVDDTVEGPAISGGTFDEDVSKYATAGKVAMVAAGGSGYKVGGIEDIAAGTLDANGDPIYYESLNDAMDASREVYLIPDNLVDGETVVVPDGWTFNIGDNQYPAGEYTVQLPAPGSTELPTLESNGECNHTPSGIGFDGGAHWEICENCGEYYNFRNHADGNGDGLCDGCGWNVKSSGRANPSTGVKY